MALRNSLITASNEAAMPGADSTPDTQVLVDDEEETQVPDIS